MENNSKCLICDRILQIKNNKNKYFVKELKSGYVVLGDQQFYKGYTLLLSKEHVTELHFLKKRSQFLNDMALTAEAVYNAFKPNKLNYELLGNTDSHLHWHIFPRKKSDPEPLRSSWMIKKSIRKADEAIPNQEELGKLKARLLKELGRLL